jgi:outer membrane protein OmpA-like peptidoglycan-associated protein
MRAALAFALTAAAVGPAAAYTTNAPPGSVPPNGNFNAPSISFSGPSIGFGAPSIGFAAPSVGFEGAGMDEATRALRPKPAPAPLAAGLEVREEAGGVRYTLSADILFDFDKATLRPKATAALDALSADVRQRFPRASFVVEGFTDAKGTDSYNLKLSERRAASVKSYLADDRRFAAGSIETRGRGEASPVAPNETPDGKDDPEGRQKNRRVEILVRPAS